MSLINSTILVKWTNHWVTDKSVISLSKKSLNVVHESLFFVCCSSKKIPHFCITQDALCLCPKRLHNYCLQLILGIKVVERKQCLYKFFQGKQRLWAMLKWRKQFFARCVLENETTHVFPPKIPEIKKDWYSLNQWEGWQWRNSRML